MKKSILKSNKNVVIRLVLFTIVFCLFIGVFVESAMAQTPDTLWTRRFGGSGYEEGNSVQQTADGGYIITGYSSSFGAGGGDVYLIKTDTTGDTMWTNTFGGPSADYGQFVQQTTDSGYIVVGGTYSFDVGDGDVYLIKTDTCGNALWTKTFGGLRWDYGYSVQEISGGGYIIAGETESFGDGCAEIYLIKTDSIGDSIWAKTYGSPGRLTGYSVQETIDGAYIVVGGESGYGDIYLIKTDTDGDSLWAKTYGGAYGDRGYSVQQTSDSGYIIVGVTDSYGSGDCDVYLIKTDVNGDSLWAKTFGQNYSYDVGYSVQETFSGGYIIAGSSSNNVHLIKTDANGNTVWTKTIGGAVQSRAYFAKQCTDGGYIVTGLIDTTGIGKADVYLIRIASDETGITEGDEIKPLKCYLSQNYPNPFNSSTFIRYIIAEPSDVRIKIYNQLGQAVRTLVNENKDTGKYNVTWDGKDEQGKKLSSGVYFYELRVDAQIATRKMLYLK